MDKFYSLKPLSINPFINLLDNLYSGVYYWNMNNIKKIKIENLKGGKGMAKIRETYRIWSIMDVERADNLDYAIMRASDIVREKGLSVTITYDVEDEFGNLIFTRVVVRIDMKKRNIASAKKMSKEVRNIKDMIMREVVRKRGELEEKVEQFMGERGWTWLFVKSDLSEEFLKELKRVRKSLRSTVMDMAILELNEVLERMIIERTAREDGVDYKVRTTTGGWEIFQRIDKQEVVK